MKDRQALLSVPTIDISSILKGSPDDKTIQELAQACEEWGFFYIVNHQVDAKFLEKAKKLCMDFFSQPKEEKDKVGRNANNLQGYSDSELTKQKVDWKQIFDICEPEELNETPKLGFHGVNQWPQGIPEFQKTMEEYYKKMQFLAKKLMESILKTLTPEEGLVEKCFANGEDTSLFRLNFYPICPNPEANLGVGPHSDPGIVTVLYQDDTVTSLQVEKEGKFYDVPPVANSFVINIGDMMQVWSNGKYKAPVHRVLANHTQSRLSVPYFLAPAYTCVVEPLDTCVGPDKPKKYKAINWGEFRKARYEGDYADVGEEIQIKHFEIK